MSIRPKEILGFLKESAAEWSDDNAARLGAALAYYTIFSIAPLLLIVIFIVSNLYVSQSNQVQNEILRQAQDLTGAGGRELIETMLENADPHRSGGVLATVLGIAALLFGATGVFAQLQGALNTVWDVKPAPGRGLKGFVMTRLLSFGMILTVGFLLLVSLVLSALLAAVDSFLQGLTPGLHLLMQFLNLVLSLGVVTLLFAMIYRYLPDVDVAWRDVWIGALFTALLFTLGKYGLGMYLGNSTTASTYGAAGSLVVLLLWVYYSAQIFFFGAEMTQVYARRYGSGIHPSKYARPIPDEVAPRPAAPPAPAVATAGRAARTGRGKSAVFLVLAFLAGRFFARH